MLVAVATLDREGPEARVSPEFGGEVGPRASELLKSLRDRDKDCGTGRRSKRF
ncbi:MAG: hypothetical protein QXF20_03375 [Candidatus Hadarchaeales archaeon]